MDPSLGSEPWVWQPEPRGIEILVGNRGMGKSTGAKVRTWHTRRLVVDDPHRDEPNLGSGRVTVGQLEQLEQLGALHAGPVRIGVRPTRWDERGRVEDFERLCRCVFRIGGLCFKSHEVGAIIAAAGRVPPAFATLIGEGRHRGVSLLLVAQRFAQVPVLARDNATRIICFRQAGPDDVDDLAKRISDQAMAEKVRTLEPHAYLEWTPESGARIRPPLGLKEGARR